MFDRNSIKLHQTTHIAENLIHYELPDNYFAIKRSSFMNVFLKELLSCRKKEESLDDFYDNLTEINFYRTPNIILGDFSINTLDGIVKYYNF